jgi:hypothetical protein
MSAFFCAPHPPIGHLPLGEKGKAKAKGQWACAHCFQTLSVSPFSSRGRCHVVTEGGGDFVDNILQLFYI